MSIEDNNMNTLKERERLAGYFLPENYHVLSKISAEKLDIIIKIIFGTDDITKVNIWPSETNRSWVKQQDYLTINYRYSKIFDFCRVLGVTHLYDIGCQSINQSFLLINHSAVFYTGISSGIYFLNDFCLSDCVRNRDGIPTTEQIPPSLCNGRIRFVSGYYPDFHFEIHPNNIAISSYSMPQPDGIEKRVQAYVRDFERIIFNIQFRKQQVVEQWKNADWGEFKVFPIGPQGFMFATKYDEDIARLKEWYPFENGRFITGIDDGCHYLQCKIHEDRFEDYAEWN